MLKNFAHIQAKKFEIWNEIWWLLHKQHNIQMINLRCNKTKTITSCNHPRPWHPYCELKKRQTSWMFLWTIEVYYLQNAITLGVGRHQCWMKINLQLTGEFQCPLHDLQTFCMMFHKNAEQRSLQHLFFSQRILFWNTKKKKNSLCVGEL